LFFFSIHLLLLSFVARANFMDLPYSFEQPPVRQDPPTNVPSNNNVDIGMDVDGPERSCDDPPPAPPVNEDSPVVNEVEEPPTHVDIPINIAVPTDSTVTTNAEAESTQALGQMVTLAANQLSDKRTISEMTQVAPNDFKGLDNLTGHMDLYELDEYMNGMSFTAEEMRLYRESRINRFVQHTLFPYIRDQQMTDPQKEDYLQSLHPDIVEAFQDFDEM
jgi:hypothetical protein